MEEGQAAVEAQIDEVTILIDEAYGFLTTEGIDLALNVVSAILILIIGFWIARKISNGVKRMMARSRHIDPAIANFFSSALRYLIIAFVLIAVLNRFGIETTSFVAILGAAGLAVGLALQGALSNVAAGVMLLIFRPFKTGHYVDAGGIAGTVAEVGLFTTEMDTPDNVRITVPNSTIWGQSITNFSHHPVRRLDIACGIGYGEPIQPAMDAMLALAKADARVHETPAPQVFVDTLGGSSVDLTLRFWCASADYWQLKWDMTRMVKEAFDEKAIEIPFPQTVITMHRPGEEVDKLAGAMHLKPAGPSTAAPDSGEG
ncbi:MAG: mechanosensitive ion channel domain-containing protein [Pseudomonadota bacterium]